MACEAVPYKEIQYLADEQDPSLTIETRDLVAKVIDNTGLALTTNEGTTSHFGRYGMNSPLSFSHHLGYHGLRALYDK
tara:strand:+ start:668 stop:901 length:234 start_codon:yes stop_codon:yes gene_type:complete